MQVVVFNVRLLILFVILFCAYPIFTHTLTLHSFFVLHQIIFLLFMLCLTFF